MRRATPYPCSGPIAARVLRTIRSSVPWRTSDLICRIRLPLRYANESSIDSFELSTRGQVSRGVHASGHGPPAAAIHGIQNRGPTWGAFAARVLEPPRTRFAVARGSVPALFVCVTFRGCDTIPTASGGTLT